MRTVGNLLKLLSYGHLSNLSMATATPGEIRVSDRNKIISYLNEGLLRLYSRFNLLERELMLNQYGHITNYHLDKRFANFNPQRLSQHLPYILDLPNEQFNDDVIKVLAVYDIGGNRLALNDENAAYSVFTPYPTTLQVPLPQEGHPLSVQYQARHPELPYSVLETEVIIPSVLENALLSFVAYLTYFHMNTQESANMATGHLSMYEGVCVEVENQGNASITNMANRHKFNKNGWI